jgi:1-acyl-sn-glycerol-3-phosphate acyltransferase
MNVVIKLFYLLIIRPWLKLIIGVQFKNRTQLKDLDQFIIVANHNSHFDSLSIMAAMPINKLKKIKVVAAGDYFGKKKLTRNLMKWFFNAILINRNRKAGEPSIIEVLDTTLKEGNSLILYPEGSRGKPGVISDFKKGIAILLKQNPNVPFIPVYLDGFGRVLPKDKKLIVPLVCKVRFGTPIYNHEENIDLILAEVKKAILVLKDQDERDRNQFTFITEKDL